MQELGYYLAGGTAVAIYYHHRLSVDLDWFTSDPMGDVMVLARHLEKTFPLEITDVQPGTLHIRTEGVRLSFLEYRYPMLQQSRFFKEYGCQVASLDDLSCMKLSAIAQRGSCKDFVDLYELVQKHRPFQELLELYQKKYSVKDVTPVLYGMVYFDRAGSEPLPEMWHGSWDEVKDACRAWAESAWKSLNSS